MGKTNRIVICGSKSVGKTSILEQSIYGNLKKGGGGGSTNNEMYPTIEDIYVANIETDRGSKEKFNFYDTAGFDITNNPSIINSENSPYISFIRHYSPLTDCFIFVYDTSSQESLDCIMTLKHEFDKQLKDKKEIIFIVLGNSKEQKTNLSDVIKLNGIQWSNKEKLKHFEVDALNRKTLHEPFVYISSKLNPIQNRSSFPQLSMGRKTIRNEFG